MSETDIINEVLRRVELKSSKILDIKSKDYLRTHEVKLLYGISSSTIRRLNEEGKIAKYVLGNIPYYKNEELLEAIKPSF